MADEEHPDTSQDLTAGEGSDEERLPSSEPGERDPLEGEHDEPVQAEEAPSPESEPSAESATIDDANLADVIAEVADETSASENPEVLVSEGESSSDESAEGQPGGLDSADIDALVAAVAEESGGSADEPLSGHGDDDPLGDVSEGDAALAVSEDDLDVLLMEADDSATEEFDTETASEPPSASDTARVGGENAAAAGTAEAEGALSQDMLDSLLADASTEDSAEPVAADDEVASEAEPAPVPTVSDALLDDLIADAEGKAPASGGASEDKELRDGIVPTGPVERLLSGLHALAGENPLRAAASLVAGAFGLVMTFIVLSSNPYTRLSDADLAAGLDASTLEVAVDTARELMEDGSFPEAESVLALAIEPADPGALRTDAEFLRLEARFEALPSTIDRAKADAVHKEIDRAIDEAPLHPRVPEALFWKAQAYEREGNPLAARATYREIFAEHPNASMIDSVLLAAGKLELSFEDPVIAAGYFQRIVEDYPASPLVDRARLNIGDALRLAGDYDSARITFVRLAQSQPGTELGAQAFERLGEVAFETGDFTSALRELETRLATATTIEGNDRVYLLLAKTHAAAGNLDKAGELLTELIDFFPESEVMPLAYIELSKVHDRSGRARDALRIVQQGTERYPEHSGLLSYAGEVLARADRPEEAALSYQRAYDAGPSDPALLLEAGRLYRRAELYSTAKSVLEKLEFEHATAPEAYPAIIEWSRVMYDMGQMTRAFDRLENLVLVTRTRPQLLQAQAALAEMYARIGFADEAARIYAEVPGLTNEPAMLARSAIALFDAGEHDEGLAIAERVDVSRLPSKDAYHFMQQRGRALLTGNVGRALDTLEQAYENYPLDRSAEGDLLLLRANLSAGRTARARGIVSEMSMRAQSKPEEREYVEQAGIAWGDHLYDRRDYRAAAEAYRTALSATFESTRMDEGPTEAQAWAMYQRANAFHKLTEFQKSLTLYTRVSASDSRWSADATAKQEAVKLEMKLRGLPVGEVQESGA